MLSLSAPLAACLVIVSSGVSIIADAQSGAQMAHIEIIARPLSAKALAAGLREPPPPLEASDFKLSQHGMRIAVHIPKAEGRYPKHLLLVTSSALSTCPKLDGAGALRALIRHGWDIRIADVHGSVTSALVGVNGLQAACQSAVASSDASYPIQELAKEPGRRIVVFLALPSSRLMIQAIRSIPEVYSIDGGVRVTSETPLFSVQQPTVDSAPPLYGVRYVSCGFANSPNKICNMGVESMYNEDGFEDGLMHERSVATALKDVLSNERYFDLSFPLPPRSRGTLLELTVHYSYHLTVLVQPYSTSSPEDGRPTVRKPFETKLQVVERM